MVPAITTASITNTTAIRYAATVSISRPAPISTAIAAPVSTMTPVPAIPGARADEDAAHEPARSVVSVRSAGIGVIGVVAVRADGSYAGIPIPIIAVAVIAHTHPNRDLGLGRLGDERGGNHHSAQQQEVPEKFHREPPRQGVTLATLPPVPVFLGPIYSNTAYF
jgi:hypothetical protein